MALVAKDLPANIGDIRDATVHRVAESDTTVMT